jgi:histidyl-tRNA synthetase
MRIKKNGEKEEMVVKVSAYKGMRDFLPEDMLKRNFVISIIKEVFENYGFEPIETPAIELWSVLSGKYGDEEKLLYKFKDRGEREVGLRYDLTVPLARFVANHLHKLSRPFKRYQIQPVWRADKPQKGRFREFYQCDIDIIGVNSLLADAEILKILYSILKKLGFNDFIININSRKIFKILVEYLQVDEQKEFLIARAIDKYDKLGIKGVREQLEKTEFSEKEIEKILFLLEITGTNSEKISKLDNIFEGLTTRKAFIEEIREILKYLDYFRVDEKHINFNPFLARGLDYYTGIISETTLTTHKIGSITGGGRYDNLIGIFSGQKIPATGSSIGLERIITIMDELNMYPFEKKTEVEVLFAVQDEKLLEKTIFLTEELRKGGIKTELYLGKKDLRKQITYALNKGISFMLILGEDENLKGEITLKNLTNREQTRIKQENISGYIRDLLNE